MAAADGTTVRPETPADQAAIADVVARAFAASPFSDHGEGRMVDRLRRSPAYLPGLALVAERGGRAVGYTMLTRAWIDDGDHATETLALAPLAVVPEAQRHGVGGALVRAAHRRAAAAGFGSIVVLGIAGYFPRFGYDRLSAHPITLPLDVGEDHALIRRLRPSALAGVRGRVRYDPAFFDH